MTPLDGPLKRALVVEGEPYTLTITPDGLNLAPKGRRKGYALAWRDLVSGEAALATALNASLAAGPAPRSVTSATQHATSSVTPAPKRAAKTAAKEGVQRPAAASPPPSRSPRGSRKHR